MDIDRAELQRGKERRFSNARRRWTACVFAAIAIAINHREILVWLVACAVVVTIGILGTIYLFDFLLPPDLSDPLVMQRWRRDA